MEQELYTSRNIIGILIIGVPFFIVLYRVFGQNVSAILNSISTLENLLTLYFSQYYLVFEKKYWVKSIAYFLRFAFSWFMILVTWFVAIVFFFSFLFGIDIVHPDTLFVLLGFFAIGIRFLIFKKGRQRGEVFSWFISICLFSFVAIGYLTQTYFFLSPTIDLLGGQIITAFFSNDLDLTASFISGLPSNPYTVLLAFVLMVASEITCFHKMSPSECGPWSLCYEIDSNVKRIIGSARIINEAHNLILEANERKKAIVWVTTTSRIEIFSKLIHPSNKSNTHFVMLNSEFPPSLSQQNIPANVKIKKSNTMQFPRGFLIIPDEKILVTSFPFRDIPFSNPSIGFITNDISIITKYSAICKKIHSGSTDL